MEDSRDSNLDKTCDNAHTKCIITENVIDELDGQVTAASIQDVKFSKTQDNVESPRANILQTWLTKYSTSHSDIGLKLSSKKNIGKSYTDSNDVNQAESSSSRDTVIKQEKSVKINYRNKKNESVQLQSNNDTSKFKISTKSCALQEVDVADAKTLEKENMARKKFKRIITSCDKKLKFNTKNNASVTPTKQKSVVPLKKSSTEKVKITPKLKLVDIFPQYDETKVSRSRRCRKDNAKENVITTIDQNKSPEPLRRSPRTVKSERKTFLCEGGHILDKVALTCVNCNVKPNKSSETRESSKDLKKVTGDSKNNSVTSKIKCKEKQVDRKVPKSQIKQSSIGKSSKSSPDTSSNSNTGKATWLTKDTGKNVSSKSNRSSKKNGSSNSKKEPKSGTKYNKLDVKINSKTSRKAKKKPSTLDNFVVKSPKNTSKRKLSRTESNESCELPSFTKTNKKVKSSGGTDSFKKYGVAVPSVEEILKEQRDLAQYKNQVESFKDVDDKFFELPFSVEDLKRAKTIDTDILDCKHLSNSEIEQAFLKNLDYISDIFHGIAYNERHERFHKGNVKSNAFTVKDLCYNTSTIVFSFEQKECLLSLLKNEFDPDDKKTLYFFQVLLPELCLKIFMSTHNMTHDQAVKYLDTRPIID